MKHTVTKQVVTRLFGLKNPNMLYIFAGALASVGLLSLENRSQQIKPLAVRAIKEGYHFKDWILAKIGRGKEDIENMMAEARHSYSHELKEMAAAIKKEKALLNEAEALLKKRMGK